MYNKYIFLISIFIFIIISSLFFHNKENFISSNIKTLGLKENTFTPESCNNVISFSGSLGCPYLSENIINTLISRGNNNNLM